MATQAQTLPASMSEFRKRLVGVEEVRTAAAAIIKAAGTSEAVGAAMAPMILNQLESLQTALTAAQAALAAVVAAAAPKPEPVKEKPPKAA